MKSGEKAAALSWENAALLCLAAADDCTAMGQRNFEAVLSSAVVLLNGGVAVLLCNASAENVDDALLLCAAILLRSNEAMLLFSGVALSNTVPPQNSAGKMLYNNAALLFCATLEKSSDGACANAGELSADD